MIALLTAGLALAIPRSQVLERSADLASHEWTTGEENLTASCLASYSSDYEAGVANVGLPYAWGGFMDTATFDQRHTANVTLDYRLGEGEGPLLGGIRAFENFGVNSVYRGK